MQGIYYGIIEEVLAPNNASNLSKYQYEYRVQVTVDGFSQIPANNCIVGDRDGTLDNFEDNILTVGAVVSVMFFNGDPSQGIIISAVRHYSKPQITTQSLWKKRYNKFELSIDKDSHFLAKSDSGPYFTIKKDQIRLDDSATENLTLDKTKKSTTLNTKDLFINVANDSKTIITKDKSVEIKQNAVIKVKGNVTLLVEGNVTVTCKNLVATVKESVNVQCKELKAKTTGSAQVDAGKDVKVIAKGKVEVEAKKEISVKAPKVKLNGETGAILTDMLNPILCPITGLKSIGVATVKAG